MAEIGGKVVLVDTCLSCFYLLHTAMKQFECALDAFQLNIAGRVCRTLRFLGENTDMPMVR